MKSALVGDRTCGGWAECKEADRDMNVVTYNFRMQGHDENKQFEVVGLDVNTHDSRDGLHFQFQRTKGY